MDFLELCCYRKKESKKERGENKRGKEGEREIGEKWERESEEREDHIKASCDEQCKQKK